MVTQKQLIDLGFSQKEANVYLALLELGPTTATKIARKAGINRTTAYDILDSLAKDSLVNFIAETKVQKFAPEHPNKVIAFLENKIKSAQSKLKQASEVIPELLTLYNTKEKPRVRYYEGIDGMREAFEDTLTSTETIRVYAVGEDMFSALSEEYFKNYFKQRVAKNISTRVIAPDTPSTREVIKNDAQEMRTTLLVDADKFYFSTETNIYDNKIMIASWKEKFALIIESEEIANGYKKTFELAWEGAKHLYQKNSISSPSQSDQQQV